MAKAQLRLTFDNGEFGEIYTMVIPLDEHVARNCQYVEPLSDRVPLPGMDTMEEVVAVLRAREFRKDLFKAQATNLGALLAERMEDAEGWHDTSRIEPAKQELKR